MRSKVFAKVKPSQIFPSFGKTACARTLWATLPALAVNFAHISKQGPFLMPSMPYSPHRASLHKNHPTAILWLAVAALSLQGCASLSENECRATDWWTVGQKDGTLGRPASALAEHRDACAEHGVAPDRDAYEKGRRSGLMVYCTRFSGYQVGRNDQPYHAGVCGGELAEPFETGLRRGRLVLALETEAWNIRQRRRELMATIGRLEHEHKTLQGKLEADESIPQDREHMQEEVEKLGQRLEALGREYEDSGERQTDTMARLREATQAAREDGYADDGGRFQLYQDTPEEGSDS